MILNLSVLSFFFFLSVILIALKWVAYTTLKQIYGVLEEFHDIFTFSKNGCLVVGGDYVTLNLMFEKPEDRTRAVAGVIKILGDKGIIPGIRNEVYNKFMFFFFSKSFDSFMI